MVHTVVDDGIGREAVVERRTVGPGVLPTLLNRATILMGDRRQNCQRQTSADSTVKSGDVVGCRSLPEDERHGVGVRRTAAILDGVPSLHLVAVAEFAVRIEGDLGTVNHHMPRCHQISIAVVVRINSRNVGIPIEGGRRAHRSRLVEMSNHRQAVHRNLDSVAVASSATGSDIVAHPPAIVAFADGQ